MKRSLINRIIAYNKYERTARQRHYGRRLLVVVSFFVYAIAFVTVLAAGWRAAAPTEAAITKQINFQGKLTAVSDGTNVADGNYTFQFKMYTASSGGVAVWTETWDGGSGPCPQLAVTKGVFNAKLGACNSLAGVDFSGGSMYVTVNFDDGGGYDGEMSPRKQINSSVFAFLANGVSGDGTVQNTVQSSTALTVARSGTNYALQVDTNTASSATGLKVTSAAAGGGIALAAISSGTNENLTLDAKGSGQISINSTATGDILMGLGGGKVGIGTTAPDRALEINDASGNDLRLTYNDNNGSAANYTDFSVSSGGNLTVAPSGGTANITGIGTISSILQVGSATAVGYSRFGTGTTTHSILGAADLLVSGQLEVDGNTFLDGSSTVAGTFTANGIVNIGDGGDAITLDGTSTTINDGTININNQATDFEIKDNTPSAYTVSQGSNNYFLITTTDAAPVVTLDTLENGGTMNFGSSNFARTVNIGTGTGADTVHIGEGGTTANTITIGTDLVANTITIGSSSATGVSITDDNWGVTTAGAGSFASLSEGGTALSSKYAPINANFVTVTSNGTLTGETGIDALTTAISTTSTLNVDSSSTLNAVTIDGGANLTMSSGTGVASQTYTGTTTAAHSIVANSLTSGTILDLSSNGTAALTGETGLNIALQGATSTNAQTTYGAQISNTHTNATSGTNVALALTASGATTANYALVTTGSVGVGTTAPDRALEINDASGNDLRLTYNDSNGSAANYADFLVSSGGNLTVAPSGGTANITGIGTVSSMLQVGSATATTYSRLGTNATGHSLSGASDLLVSGKLEVDGNAFLDGTLTVASTISASNLSGTNTGDQTITLSGDVSGSGTGAITATIGNDKITEPMLKAVNAPTDEYCLSYESTGGDFEWQACGGGSQTPWTSDIVAAGFDLTDLSNLLFRETTGAPTGSDVGFYRDNSGDLTGNVLTGKTFNLAVNGSDEYNFSSTALALNGNNITGVGTAITAAAGLTITATAADLALVTATSGNITMAPAGTGSVQVTSGVTSGTTTTSGLSFVANSLSSGVGVNLSSSSTAAASNTQTLLNIALSGTNGTSGQTTYGAQISNTHAGTTSSNVALQLTASGGTLANYALVTNGGNVGLGDTTPNEQLAIGAGGNILQNAGNFLNPYGSLGTYSNLIKYSEAFDNAEWVKSNISAVTANGQTSPDGSSNAESLATSSSGGNVCNFSATAAGSNTFTFAVWVRAASGTQSFGLRIDAGATSCATANNVTGTEQTFTATTSWKRYYVTQTFSSATGNVKVRIFPGTSGGSGTVYAWGSQLEQASAPNDYAFTYDFTLTNTNRGGTIESNVAAATGSSFGTREVMQIATGNDVDATYIAHQIRVYDNDCATDCDNTTTGLQVAAYKGTNLAGTNIGIDTYGYTFGIQATTTGQASNVSIPAAVFADLDNGSAPTVGNAIRAYSNNATSADLVYLYTESTTYSGNALLMDLGNGGGGSFTGNFLSLKNRATQKAHIDSNGYAYVSLQSANSAALCWDGTGGTDEQIKDCNSTPSADYAEMYPVAAGSEEGDIVALGDKVVDTYDQKDGNVNWDKVKGKINQLVPSERGYQSNLIGIVSGNYLDFSSTGYNIKQEDNPKSIALNGRVPVKVTNENGVIHAGDYITSSATKPGYGMKAVYSGQVVGQALADQDFASGNEATVMVFVHVGYQQIGSRIVLDAPSSGDGSLQGGGLQGGEGVAPSNGLASSANSTFVIQQQTATTETDAAGVGDILQVQSGQANRFLISSTGATSILSNLTCAADTNLADCPAVLAVTQGDTNLAIVDARGTLTLAGTIIIKDDTFAGSVATDSDGFAEIDFSYNLGTGKPVIQLTTEAQIPVFSQIYELKKDDNGNYTGFIIRTYDMLAQPVRAIVHYNVTGKEADYITMSQGSALPADLGLGDGAGLTIDDPLLGGATGSSGTPTSGTTSGSFTPINPDDIISVVGSQDPTVSGASGDAPTSNDTTSSGAVAGASTDTTSTDTNSQPTNP